MGWWQINSVEKGQIDWSVKRDDNELINAIPGKHDATKMYNGDEPADIMDEALDKIEKAFIRAWKRPPCRDEYLACFNFCVNGKFRK